MPSSPPRRLALVAGAVLSLLPGARPARAQQDDLSPRFTRAVPTGIVVGAGQSLRLLATAEDPQSAPLTFSWSTLAGEIRMPPVSGPNDTSLVWTAPLCPAGGSTPVSVTATNNLGLSTTAGFAIGVRQDLSLNRQTSLYPEDFATLQNVTLTPNSRIQTAASPPPPSVDRIVFDHDQPVSISLVGGTTTASDTLGWLYYDDLVARGYIDTQGTPADSSDDTLRDANGNGIADLHEDLYNLAPPTGPQARPYIGTSRRCARTFTSRGITYSQPDLALNGACAAASGTLVLEDARPGPHPRMQVDAVGGSYSPSSGVGHSDNGLFPRIPNLLEPAHPQNGNLGLGKLVFLLTDDDGDSYTYKNIGVVADQSTVRDGIPDYDVSAYDAQGLPRATNPDPGITAADRTVNLGTLPAGREVVFFLVTLFEGGHTMAYGAALPCLRKDPDGRCTLHLLSPVSVFFTKAKWNLDQDPVGQLPAVARNLGCDYSLSCTERGPEDASSASCPVAATGQPLCGWLDYEMNQRLRRSPYNLPPLAREAAIVPTSGTGTMPHALLSASSTAPDRWFLGFEDLSGGGDRDFNDAVFMLQLPPQPGMARSRIMTPADPNCALSRVRFQKSDTIASGCSAAAFPISYAVATDCGSASPTWRPLNLAPGWTEALVDVSSTPGSQLCWKAELPVAKGNCQPALTYVNLGYEAVGVSP